MSAADASAAGATTLSAFSRVRGLGPLTAAVFLVFFQTTMVAPLVPVLAAEFAAPAQLAGLLVSAYALPYGITALIYGPLSDRLGRRQVIALCLSGVAVAAVGAALAPTLAVLAVWRVVAGLSAGGVMPVSLAYVADLYAYNQRGRAIGIVFAALAAGQAVGYSLAPAIEAWADWRMIFAGLALVAVLLLILLLLDHPPLPPTSSAASATASVQAGYGSVLADARARRVYAFIVVAGLTTSGTASWFGVYVHERHGLDSLAIALAYLAYGVVGLSSPLTGSLADRIGRGSLIPLGMASIAVGALCIAVQGPLPLALLGLAGAGFGLQLTYPLLAGLASEFSPSARGRALGLNTFSMFMGVASGSFVVGLLLPLGFGAAFGTMALAAALSAIAAYRVLRHER